MSSTPSTTGSQPTSRLVYTLLVIAVLGTWVVPRAYVHTGLDLPILDMAADVHDHLVSVDRRRSARRLAQGEGAHISTTLKDAFSPRLGLRHPPGVYAVADLWSRHLGPLSLWTTWLTLGLFALVLIVGIVLMGRAMHSLEVGLWAALFCGLCPGLMSHTIALNLDLPLAAMILMGAYLVQASRGLSRTGPTLALALWSMLAIQIKMPYFASLLAPSLLALALGLKDKRLGWRQAGVLLLSLALVVFGVFHFLGDGGKELHSDFLTHAEFLASPRTYFAERGMDGLLRIAYPVAGIWYNDTWLALLLALPGVIMAHTARARGWRHTILGVLWGTYLFAATVTMRDIRFLLPIYPLLCLLTAWWPAALLPPRWRRVALGLMALALGTMLWTEHQFPEQVSTWSERGERLDMTLNPSVPSREDLKRLGRLRYSMTNDLRPLAKALDAVLKGQHLPGVLIVSMAVHDGVLPFPTGNLLNTIHLMAAQLRPEAMVWVSNVEERNRYHKGAPRPPSPFEASASYLLRIHDPGSDPEKTLPGHKLLQRYKDTFYDAHQPGRSLVFSLFKKGD